MALVPPSPGRAARWLAHAATLVVLVCGLLGAGTAYAFCPVMQRVTTLDKGCCGSSRSTVDGPRPVEVERLGCCEVLTTDLLPTVDTSTPPELPPGVAVALLPQLPAVPVVAPARVVWERAAPSPPRAAMPIRAGPTSPQRCALLQRYLL